MKVAPIDDFSATQSRLLEAIYGQAAGHEDTVRLKVKAFENVVVSHSHLERVVAQLLHHINNPASVRIVVLLGPAGIGKSLVMNYLANKLNENLLRARPDDADFRPVIQTVAMASGHRQFSFKSLYASALHAIGDPMIYRAQGLDSAYLRSIGLGTTAELRGRLGEEIKLRNLMIWLLDEAHHAVLGGKSGSPVDQLDVFKSISQMHNCMLVFAGPCRMDSEIMSSSQLARRSVIVPFHRYRHDVREELEEFASVANQFLASMELQERPATADALDMLYDGTAGCIGILKDWLTRAYAKVLVEASDPARATLSLDDLHETRILDLAGMGRLMAEIEQLDERIKVSSSQNAFAQLVRGGPLGTATSPAAWSEAPRPAQKRRVGIRKPTRDSLVAPGMATS